MKAADAASFSPRNGEVILKATEESVRIQFQSFSPRNGEVILKLWGFIEEIS